MSAICNYVVSHLQGLTPLSIKTGLANKQSMGGTPHHPAPSRLAVNHMHGQGGPLYQPLEVGMGMLDPLDSIPAHFGQLGLGADESTLDLRRNVLRTR